MWLRWYRFRHWLRMLRPSKRRLYSEMRGELNELIR